MLEKILHVVAIVLLIAGVVFFYLLKNSVDNQSLWETLSFVFPTIAAIIEVVVALLIHKSAIFWEDINQQN